MNGRTLVVASYNLKKLKELKELLRGLGVRLCGLGEFTDVREVAETGATFRENAAQKALEYARQTRELTLADDSGLEVDYLKGAPGVYSARFAGPGKDDRENCLKVLKLLEGMSEGARTAAFRCAVALASPERVIAVVEDEVKGRITRELRGEGGFGYDPLFFYPEFGKTFGEIPPDLKHSVSHRGKALCKMQNVLKDYLKSGC